MVMLPLIGESTSPRVENEPQFLASVQCSRNAETCTSAVFAYGYNRFALTRRACD